MKKLIASTAAVAGLLAFGGTASAAGNAFDSNGCLDGWTYAQAVSDSAQFVDEKGNGDGYVCYKVVPGNGNGNVANLGEFLVTNAVAKDNKV